MRISAKRLSGSVRLVLPVLMACAGSAQAQAPWLVLPPWKTAPDAVIAAEGAAAVPQVPRPGSRVFDQDFMVETPVRVDDLGLNRQFYFDDKKRLTVVRIMPSALSGANCTALLTATTAALGVPDETKTDASIASISFENAFWLRPKDDRVYRWVRLKASAIPDDKTPCHVLVEPYEAGMARKKRGKG
ncbi:MAG: hypothetical protein J7485_12520 [Sphingobium sp.]|nr:hypothetical protein [Sphingobium sp.]